MAPALTARHNDVPIAAGSGTAAAFAAAVTAGAGWGTAILHAWTEADQALWAGVLNFWFLGLLIHQHN